MPLHRILGFSERLLREVSDEKTHQGLERIHNEAQRATRILQNLLTFAHHEPRKEYSDINNIIQKALELRVYELNASNISVITDLAFSLPRVVADSRQIQQVFLNIILNAEDAMTEARGGGHLTIKTQKVRGCVRVSLYG